MEEIRAIDLVIAVLKDLSTHYDELRGHIIYFKDINKFKELFREKYCYKYEVDLTKKDWETAQHFYRSKISIYENASVSLWFSKEDFKNLCFYTNYSLHTDLYDKILEVWKTVIEQ